MKRGIVGKLKIEVPKSSMRSSNSGGGILGHLRTKVPRFSMRSSNSGGLGGVFLVSSKLKSPSLP